MDQRLDYALLTLCDGPVADDMSYDEFQVRLIHGLLFEPGFVIMDAYIFASNHLRRHIEESRQGAISLFELAVKQGIIAPATRTRVPNYQRLLEEMRRGQINSHWPGNRELALRLDLSCPIDKSYVWPTQMEESYRALVERCMLGLAPPGVEPDVWALTEELRVRSVARACAVTHEITGNPYALRRGELVRAAGVVLGVVKADDRKSVDRYQIVTRYGSADADAQKVNAIAHFFDWVDELHRANYAQALNVKPSIFGSTATDMSLMQSAVGSPTSQSGPSEPRDELNITIRVPSLERLLHWPPERLLDVRNYGLDWRVKAHIFLECPTTGTRHRAEEALEIYARKIRHLSPSLPYIDLSVKAFASKAAPGLTAAFLGFAAPSWGPYVATTASSGYIAYQYLIRGRHATAKLQLKSNVIAGGSVDPLLVHPR